MEQKKEQHTVLAEEKEAEGKGESAEIEYMDGDTLVRCRFCSEATLAERFAQVYEKY